MFRHAKLFVIFTICILCYRPPAPLYRRRRLPFGLLFPLFSTAQHTREKTASKHRAGDPQAVTLKIHRLRRGQRHAPQQRVQQRRRYQREYSLSSALSGHAAA